MTKQKSWVTLGHVLLCTAVVLLLIALRGLNSITRCFFSCETIPFPAEVRIPD